MKSLFNIKKSIALILAVACMLCSMAFTVSAADDYAGYGTGTRSFRVTTQAAWYYPGAESITFKNNKATYVSKEFNIWTWKYVEKSKSLYPRWDISIVSTDKTHKVNKTMTGGSLKIKLKRNKVYNVTVSYSGSNFFNLGTLKGTPSWSVKGLWKATIN